MENNGVGERKQGGGGEVWVLGWGGGKGRELCLNNNKIRKNKYYYTHIITLPTTLKQALLLPDPVYKELMQLHTRKTNNPTIKWVKGLKYNSQGGHTEGP